MRERIEVNVLMFGWEFPPHISGGLGTACHGLTKALAQLGNVRTTLVLPRCYGGEDTCYVTIRCPADRPDHPPGAGASAYSDCMLPSVWRFADGVREMTGDIPVPDIIHAHDWLTAPAALAAQRILDRPLVFHVHSTEFDRAGSTPNPAIVRIETEILQRADAVLAVSGRTRDQLINTYGVDPDRVDVVYNGIDVAGTDAGVRTVSGQPLVCFLGRVTYQKGPAYFLRAAAVALAVNPALRFVLAGDGDLQQEMISLAAALGIADRVTFTGFLMAEEVEHLFRHAEALVMPSVSEPFGMVALEAAAAGVPVIVSDSAGVTEVLSHVIRIGYSDVQAIADAMLAVTSDDMLAQRLRMGSRGDIERVSWRRAAAHVRQVYQQLGARSRVPRVGT